MDKEKLKQQLKEIEDKEQEEIAIQNKKKNFENFMKRTPDYMVGKAHCELNFINKRYASDRKESVIPTGVTISGNCSKTYFPIVDMTESTKIYFHNVWRGIDQQEFQEKLNKFVQKYIEKYSRELHSVLEMMGLQSLHYYVREEFFLPDDLVKVKREIEVSQKEILDTYSDSDFKKLGRKVTCYGTDIEKIDLNLFHSRSILQTYLSNYRPHLLEVLGFKK